MRCDEFHRVSSLRLRLSSPLQASRTLRSCTGSPGTHQSSEPTRGTEALAHIRRLLTSTLPMPRFVAASWQLQNSQRIPYPLDPGRARAFRPQASTFLCFQNFGMPLPGQCFGRGARRSQLQVSQQRCRLLYWCCAAFTRCPLPPRQLSSCHTNRFSCRLHGHTGCPRRSFSLGRKEALALMIPTSDSSSLCFGTWSPPS